MSKPRRWCFTLNNYSEEDVSAIRGWDVTYAIVGKEVGESGTPHLQGYVVLAPSRLAAMKKLLEKAHWEPAKGNTEQNVEYCSKQGDVFEVGVRPVDKGKAEKLRWQEAWKALTAGDMDSVPEDIKIRYYRTCKDIVKDHMVKPDDADDVTGVWIYGDAGVGKSRMAREKYPGAYYKNQNKWWDGYQGEEFVIIDDFDSKELAHHLKIWADRYSFIAETKGGGIHIRPKKIVVTSNFSIEELFASCPQVTIDALRRRFQVTHMYGAWPKPLL